jgi:hypothetical protein
MIMFTLHPSLIFPTGLIVRVSFALKIETIRWFDSIMSLNENGCSVNCDRTVTKSFNVKDAVTKHTRVCNYVCLARYYL